MTDILPFEFPLMSFFNWLSQPDRLPQSHWGGVRFASNTSIPMLIESLPSEAQKERKKTKQKNSKLGPGFQPPTSHTNNGRFRLLNHPGVMFQYLILINKKLFLSKSID